MKLPTIDLLPAAVGRYPTAGREAVEAQQQVGHRLLLVGVHV